MTTKLLLTQMRTIQELKVKYLAEHKLSTDTISPKKLLVGSVLVSP